jgi:uncharacterized protein (TIGR00369 family)
MAEVEAYLAEVFPQAADDFVLEHLESMQARVRMNIQERHLRPGGTVSGPTMFALADCAIYMAVLGMIGRVPLAVTTNANIDFMRKPESNTDIIAHCKLLKLGRVLAVGDVLIYSDGKDAPVARAALTYSIPPGATG